MSEIRIVPIAHRHRADWDRLYAGYAEFYQVTQTPEMRERVWSWLHDPTQVTEGLIAEDGGGRAIGFAHYRAFARPLSATIGGYLDDLFVDPGMRGKGGADALINALAEEGRRRGWSVIRWITAESNTRARVVYDRLAKLTARRTYDIPPCLKLGVRDRVNSHRAMPFWSGSVDDALVHQRPGRSGGP